MLLLLCGACSPTLSCNLLDVASKHTIMANPEGQLVSPRSHERAFSHEYEDEEYMEGVLNELNTYVSQNDSDPVKVLIFIHGGLNQSEDSILRAGCWTEAIMKNWDKLPDCKKPNYNPNEIQPTLAKGGYFPIFINWRSWLVSTYGEHLVATRQGERWSSLAGWASSPFVFLGDLGRAVFRAPIVWIQQVTSDLESYRGTPPFGEKNVVYKHYQELRTKMRSSRQEQIHVSIGKDHGPPGIFALFQDTEDSSEQEYYDPTGPDGSWWEGAAGFVTAVLTQPTKLLASPFIDAAGKPAWDMMNRRTELLRRQPQEFDKMSQDNKIYLERTGAVARFLDRFAKMLPRGKCGEAEKVEVTIIGHSMGTIIANWMIADYGAELNLKNIVYMAAASKISDFERQVIPYLTSKAGEQTQFYNLVLHPRAEVRERNIRDLSPRGSLLVWIDNYLSNPENFLDRTLGRWDNIIVAPHIFPEKTRGRINIKAFGICRWFTKNPQVNPERHGEFTKTTFWRSDFWEPDFKEPPLDYCPKQPQH